MISISPWRPCPFSPGHRYRVEQNFTALRATFQAGVILTFQSDAWSLRAWDIPDDDDVEIWRELFEELP